MKKVAVQCRQLRLAYGSTEVLKNVDLDIAPGEFFALLGPSGSGKSTLLRAIAGFAQHQQGQLLIDGVDVSRQPPWARNVGMVFQSYALWPHLSVWDNVAFGLVERKMPRDQIRQKVGTVLDMVGLADYAQRRPGQLSGGQQQRVALARTVVIEPQVLLLDEPLSNLDKTLRVQMRQELLSMQRRLGLTTIFVTHDQEEAMTTADRMAVLDQGVVQQVGSPMALYDEPANAFVAQFVGTTNLLPARVSSRSAGQCMLQVDGVGDVPWPATDGAAAADRLLLSLRPHALQLQDAGAARDEQRVWLTGTVASREFLGEFTRYHVRVGERQLAVDEAHHAGRPGFAAGTVVQLGLQPAQARLLAA
jgi:iron(III) transport system ATP-binding protein